MTANSKREELNGTYALLALAAEPTFLLQSIGSIPVRIVAVADGDSAPADDSVDYFVLSTAFSGSDALSRGGFEGADVYARSDSDSLSAFITRIPS